ncbi:hypothetical protein ACWGDX_29535 [Streptomyces sp. NPDC055025]
MKRPFFRRCGHAPGAISPEDQAVVDQARAMLAAVRVGPFIERAHPRPGDDPAALIPRIPRAIHTHGLFLRHPHPDHGCEWDDTWRMIWAPATETGAGPDHRDAASRRPDNRCQPPQPRRRCARTWAA